jgi:hypothetical protein
MRRGTYVSTGVRARAAKKGGEPASVIAVVLMVMMVVMRGCCAFFANNDVDVWGCNSRGCKPCENERVLHDE